MRVTVKNIGKGPRGFHNSRGRVVILAPGESSKPMDIDHGTEYMISKSDDYDVTYHEDAGEPQTAADLLARAADMTATEFKDAVNKMLGTEFSTKKAALEALENADRSGT